MDGLKTNRNKREAEFQCSSPSGSFYNHLHVAKKPKPSSSSSPCIDRTKTSPILVSRLSLYPPLVNRIDREILAPCINVIGFTPTSKRFSTNSSGIIRQKSAFADGVVSDTLFSKYSHAKESAIGDCRHAKFEEESDGVEVIDVDNGETLKNGKAVLGNSSIKEVEMVADDINRSEEVQEIAAKYRALDQKAPSTSSEVISEIKNRKILESLLLPQPTSLRKLRSAIKILETKVALQQQSHSAKRKEDVANDPFRSLTEEEEEMVVDALFYSMRSKVLVTHENSTITITGEVLRCLSPGAWLNDEVINVYLELLKERENREPKLFLKCHFFNTFFYKKLISGKTGYDYKSVRRWTTHRRLGYSLLECDKIFVPIHKEIHWCLAVINKKERKFQYLDPLGGADKKVPRMLATYITDEVKDKTGKDIDVTSWEQEFVTDLPCQKNGHDCGMFMLKYADFYSRGIGLCFNQEHMPYFRLRTAKEILKLRAE